MTIKLFSSSASNWMNFQEKVTTVSLLSGIQLLIIKNCIKFFYNLKQVSSIFQHHGVVLSINFNPRAQRHVIFFEQQNSLNHVKCSVQACTACTHANNRLSTILLVAFCRGTKDSNARTGNFRFFLPLSPTALIC